MENEKGMYHTSPQHSEIEKILRGESTEAIPQEELAALIPDAVRKAASNPDQLEVRQLPGEPGVVYLMILERNFTVALTDPDAYAQWKADKKKVMSLPRERDKFRQTPAAPSAVNRLHAKFEDLIDTGVMQFSDRILMVSKFVLSKDNPQALHVYDFDGESHKGIGQDFYKNTLPAFAKKIGLRFIVGANNAVNSSFFTETLGRYSVQELKPEYHRTLFSGRLGDYRFSIQFLYPEDVEKYIDPKWRK